MCACMCVCKARGVPLILSINIAAFLISATCLKKKT